MTSILHWCFRMRITHEYRGDVSTRQTFEHARSGGSIGEFTDAYTYQLVTGYTHQPNVSESRAFELPLDALRTTQFPECTNLNGEFSAWRRVSDCCGS